MGRGKRDKRLSLPFSLNVKVNSYSGFTISIVAKKLN
jgi:hypothetical protein